MSDFNAKMTPRELVAYAQHYRESLEQIAQISDGFEARQIADDALHSGPVIESRGLIAAVKRWWAKP